nr:SHOCT domain-containing protein [uncultured Methanobacterium sp.]
MKIKGSSEATGCDCILEKEGLLLKYKGFFGGDKGEEFIKYSDMQNISLEKTAGLVSSPLLIIDIPNGTKKVVLLDKHFKMFYALLEANTPHIPSKKSSAIDEPVENSSILKSITGKDNKKKEESLDVGESNHFKSIAEAKKLRDMGAITEEEYNLIKSKHLKNM